MSSRQLGTVLLCVIVAVLLTSDVKGKETTEYRTTLDPDDRYNITWSFTGHEPQDEITFTVEVETTGWVGLGFSPQGSMAGADIIVAWVDEDGTAHLQDMMADSNGLPESDVSQDATLISASESDGKTTITFSRKLSTCDDSDRFLTTDTTRLIYAYSFLDPSDNTLSVPDKHAENKRGSKSIYLFDHPSAQKHVPDDVLYLDITSNQYEVPENDTTYYCTFHAAPEVDKKHHLIGVEPIIEHGNEGVVHHMVLYACWNVTLEHLRGSNTTEGLCYTPEMPEFQASCREVVSGWAVGGGGYYYPEEVGYPLGTGDLDSPEFFMLETHYDNPAMKSGIIDSSGLRLVYTPKIRENDLGMFTTGSVFGIMAPPKAKAFDVIGYCHSSCTESWIPEEGITLINYLLHAHLLAVKIKAEVFRDGKPAEVLAVDNSYDFNFQENRFFAESTKLYPGDTVKVTCTLDSSKRNGITIGGFSTRDEMCLTFLGYYPKQPFAACESIPSYVIDGDHDFYRAVGDVVYSYEYSTFPFVDMQSTFANFSWSADRISETQDIVQTTPHLNSCRLPVDGFPDVQQFPVDEYKSLPDAEEDNSYCKLVVPDKSVATTCSLSTSLLVLVCILKAF